MSLQRTLQLEIAGIFGMLLLGCMAGTPNVISEAPATTSSPEQSATTPTSEPSTSISEPSADIPIPPTPMQVVLSQYESEVRPLAEKLEGAQKVPADFKLPPPIDWQIILVPLSDRLYYVQNHLFPEWASGDSAKRTKLYIVYTYERGEGLSGGVAASVASTAEVIGQIRLVAEADEKFYLLEEKREVGGRGSKNEEELVQ